MSINKPIREDKLAVYRDAKNASKCKGFKCIPYQWQNALKAGWEIIKPVSTYDNYDWFKPSGEGTIELVGPVDGTDLEMHGFDKPTLDSLKKEMELLYRYIHEAQVESKVITDELVKQATLVNSLLYEFHLINC
jgi:hypothetical protein